MPFGCFGKRKRQERIDKPCDKPDTDGTKNNATDGVDKPAEDSGAEVNEVITVARTHSLHASAPNSVEHRHTTIGIQKSATLARYDFLRKSDYTNTADRWAALKQQYLESAHAGQNGSAGGGGSVSGPSAVKRAAMSLPRQFAPPSSSSSVVRFSQWFYERQTMEVDARREFHEREEKTRKLLDGVEQDSIPEDNASSRVEVSNNGFEKPVAVDNASTDNANETVAVEAGAEKAPEAASKEQESVQAASAAESQADVNHHDNQPVEVPANETPKDESKEQLPCEAENKVSKAEQLPQKDDDENNAPVTVTADHSADSADGRGAENVLENQD